MRRQPVAGLALIAFIGAACSSAPATPAERHIDVAGLDTTVAPGDDFDRYANGGWRKATPIPADHASYGAFDLMWDTARTRIQALIQDAAKRAASDADQKRIADFYASYMDTAMVEAAGIAPLKPLLDSIAAIGNREALSGAIGRRIRVDVDPLNNAIFETPHLFGLWITQALDEPSETVPYLLQGGLGMPDRDYYLSPTPQMRELRAKYQAYVDTVFRLAGFSDPAARGARVVALETKMARAHATRVESEDVHRPQSWKRGDFTKKAPGVDWDSLFAAAHVPDAARFMVWHPKATPALAALVASEPLDAWKDWLSFHAIDDMIDFLPRAYVEAGFAFYGVALSGMPEQLPRSKRGAIFTSAFLGGMVGKAYAARYFPPETKKRVQDMVAGIVTAFGARIDALEWMTPATKAKAKAKLATLKVGVGYPDKWTDYSSLVLAPGDLFGNVRRAREFADRHQLVKLHKPVDRTEWWMTPQTVNAVNLPLQNALNFPAAIIMPPFFDVTASSAYNYGSMGAVIGHEISHTFDNQGSEFDPEGKLANWWTKEDFDHFKAAGEALAKQYDAYRPVPDLAVNGHQTLGENIADVAGLSAAYDAYRASLHGTELPVYKGFTGDQQFFISFGQTWRENAREALVRQLLATDDHAPARYRAATVRNIDAWYSAFSPKAGQGLYLDPKERVRIW